MYGGRLVSPRSVAGRLYEEVVDGIVAVAKRTRLGSGLDADVDMGAMAASRQRDGSGREGRCSRAARRATLRAF